MTHPVQSKRNDLMFRDQSYYPHPRLNDEHHDTGEKRVHKQNPSRPLLSAKDLQKTASRHK